MKHFFTTLLFSLSPTLMCFAQEESVSERPLPKVIVQTGIGFQWFGENYKMYHLSAEIPYSRYWHLGIQSSFYLREQSSYYYTSEFLGGYELGAYSKYFLHGRFSGRKSGLFLGPEFRYGTRKFRSSLDFTFPPPPVPNYQYYEERVTKVMLRWGIQWQFRHAVLELSSPIGAEFYRPSDDAIGLGYSREAQFVMLPSIQLGIAF